MKIGVLALQGAFIEHIQILKEIKIDAVEIRKKSDLSDDIMGIIIPGGESTVIAKLLNNLDMLELLREKIQKGLPVFGTCAGLILLAKEIYNPIEGQITLGTMDITVKRNAYGRQLGSFYTEGEFVDIPEFPMVFIRAPYITKIGETVEVISTVDGKIVAAKQDNQLVTAFHPELTKNNSIHRYFVNEMVATRNYNSVG